MHFRLYADSRQRYCIAQCTESPILLPDMPLQRIKRLPSSDNSGGFSPYRQLPTVLRSAPLIRFNSLADVSWNLKSGTRFFPLSGCPKTAPAAASRWLICTALRQIPACVSKNQPVAGELSWHRYCCYKNASLFYLQRKR